jgi:hypothetical protein
MAVVTVTLSSPGTATVSDETALAVANLQTSLELLLGNTSGINAKLTTINASLGTLNSTLVLTNTALNTNLGFAGASTLGNLSNSALLTKDVLSILAETQIQIQENINEVTSSMGLLQYSVSGMGSAIQEGVAVNTFAVADQIDKNAFEKAATKEALQRADLPEPQPETFPDAADGAIRKALTVNTAATATAYLEQSFTSGLTRAGTYASEQVAASQVGKNVTDRLLAFKNWLFGTKVAEKTRNDTLKAGLVQARTGTKPTV